MFAIKYKIINSEFDDFDGQNGFFQLKVNDFNYGEIYDDHLEYIMDKDCIYDWFSRLIKVVKALEKKDVVYLSDVETPKIWIEFRICKANILISIIEASKLQGSKEIEFELQCIKTAAWSNQKVSYDQFVKEVHKKSKEYAIYIEKNNSSLYHTLIDLIDS